MSLITRMRKEFATYWPLAKPDADGQPTWGFPQQIKVRWEALTHQAMTAEDEVDQVDTQVYVPLLAAGAEVGPGGMLVLGAMTSSMAGSQNPRLFGGREVIRYKRFPSYRETEWLRVAYLAR